MATRYLARSLLPTKQSLASIFSHSPGAGAVIPNSSSFLFRLRPLVAAASASYFRRLVAAISTRAFSTRQTTSSLNDPNPNCSNRPPKETILLDGCDFEHWLVVVEKPEGDPTRDEIIDSYIKTLAKVLGSEEEARMKIYSVSTRHYYAFGALVAEEYSNKLKEVPGVRWVLPDSYLDVKNKDYGDFHSTKKENRKMAMRSVVTRGGQFSLRSSASSLRYFSGATGRVPSEVERAKETGFFKKMAKQRPWEQKKSKLRKLELPTHYLEVNYKTLKAVVFHKPDIRHMGIPHGLRGEGGGGKDGEIR